MLQKIFDILTLLSVLHNYFDGPTKFSDPVSS